MQGIAHYGDVLTKPCKNCSENDIFKIVKTTHVGPDTSKWLSNATQQTPH